MVNIAIRILEGMFFIGVAGSALVVFLTAVEDIRTLFGSEKDES